MEEIILSNSVRSWLVVLGTIAFIILFKTVISRNIAEGLYRLLKQKWSYIDKPQFIGRVLQPLSWSIVIFISVVALDRLVFPEAFKFTLLDHHSEFFIPKIGTLLLIIAVTWFIVGLVNFVAFMLEKQADNVGDQAITFLRDILKVLVVVAGLLAILQMVFNKDVRVILQGLTIIGAAIALAAKESLENLIASFIIFFDKPFYAGDFVKVNNVSGTVERIGLRSTRIRTLEKTLVTIPNKQMVDSVVDNLSMRIGRRAEIKMEFDAKTPPEKINTFINKTKDILENHKEQMVSSSVFLLSLIHI